MKKHIFALLLLSSAPFCSTVKAEESTARTETSLWAAAIDFDVDGVKAALNHKADINKQDEDTGNTALMAMFSFDACDDPQCEDKKAIIEITKLFIEHQADFSITNNDNQTALDLAKEHGHIISTELIEAAV